LTQITAINAQKVLMTLHFLKTAIAKICDPNIDAGLVSQEPILCTATAFRTTTPAF
jgi:hypothetical protein